MKRPIIEVSTDLAGGIVLSTSDKWLVEDACESVASALSAKAFVDLAVAIDGFDKNNGDSVVALYAARDAVSVSVANKQIVLARMLPFEIVGLIKALTDALEQSA
jgi:hypothetical protein